MPDIKLLSDHFPGVALDAQWTDPFGVFDVSGGTLNLSATPPDAFSGVVTETGDHDLTGSFAHVRIRDVVEDGGGAVTQVFLELREDGSTPPEFSLRFGYRDGMLRAEIWTAGPTLDTVLDITYDDEDHAWVRILVDGDDLDFDTSATGVAGSWTTRATASLSGDVDFDISTLDVGLTIGAVGGGAGSAATASFDNLNVDTLAGTTGGVVVGGDPAALVSGEIRGTTGGVVVGGEPARLLGVFNWPAEDVLPVRVELRYDGTWNDITSDVYHRAGVTITEGRPDEASVAEPSQMRLQLNNRDGRYSPKNPTGPLYGKIGRNTPIRCYVGDRDPTRALVMPGNYRSFLAAPHTAGDDITGDIDLRLEVTFDEWPVQDAGLGRLGLARRYTTLIDGNRAWALYMITGETEESPGAPVGTLALRWSADGETTFTRTSGEPIGPTPGEPVALRATLDVDDDGDRTVTFYTAASIGGPWTQLGGAITETGTTSINASTADLEVGRIRALVGGGAEGIVSDSFHGQVRAFEVRSGIDGTVINSADLTVLDVGTRSFASAQGDEWRVYGGAHLADRSFLFAGEVSSWPPRWDVTGADVYAPIEASGISRRLQQGRKPLGSAVRRGIPDTLGTVAYWPCEDGDDATSLASAFEGHPSGSLFGDVSLSAYDGFVGSAPIPEWGEGGRLHLAVPEYTEHDDQRLTCLVHVPEDGVESTTRLFAAVSTGSVKRWEMMLNPAGELAVHGYDVDGTLVADSGFFAADMNGANQILSLILRQQGSDIAYGYQRFNIDAGESGQITPTPTVAGHTYGRIEKVYTQRHDDDLAGTAIGQIVISSPDVVVWSSAFYALRSLVVGLTGETAADRLDRLATEEGISTALTVGPDLTEPMGAQTQTQLVDLLQQTSASDLAVMGDARDQLAVAWRSRHSLYNQEPALELDYTAQDLSETFTPEEDDQAIRNDVTVSRVGGSERREVATTGPLSVDPPPDGVGRYDESVSLSLASDGQLGDQAAWRLHLGTYDDLRYPSVTVAVHRRPDLLETINRIRIGARISIVNLPPWLPPGGASMLVNRVERRLSNYLYIAEFTCTPADPWAVALTGLESPAEAGPTDRARADTAGSELALDASDSATTLTVVTTLGPIWTTDTSNMPFDAILGGETVRVTAITSSVEDTFSRAETDEWGDADVGGAWALVGGAASDRSVDGAAGVVTLFSSPSTIRFQAAPGFIGDAEVRVRMSVDQVATGAAFLPAVLLRGVDSSDYYRARLHFDTDGSLSASVTRGTTTVGGTTALTHLGTYEADDAFEVRVRLTGHTIRMRVWAAGDDEPSIWHHAATITADTIDTGAVGLTASAFSGNSNTDPELRYDNFEVLNPQLMTVTRSVNGIEKPHDAGTSLSLAYPARAAL